MPRLMLTDEMWSKLKAILLDDRVYNKQEHRFTMEGILYRLRVGCPWRDLPEYFGLWNTIYRRFLLWSRKGILLRLFKTLSTNSDTEWEFIDGSYVKAHQHSSGASSDENQAIGLSRGGNTSKIHLAVDSFGLPIEFIVTGGEVHDSKAANALIELLPQSHFIIADKGYDSEAIRDKVRECGSKPVIPRRQNSKQGNGDIDWCLYKYRHLVENAFARLKHFRAIATRYDKLKINFESLLALACSIIWLPM
ncbi:IS5 family transposase [Shewanella livingstonensis]|uniref:IS5 family transposase n=1 Tax=Shewanella livingstonensis TaxID=150120 RepID=A0A3G8LWJ8_9GAMM|nr:IS5 family transposase [Shewanella livingstonensis]AZG73535.1 IS5 family transposase [Shewanella livingstonensis]